jgi:hypothetical protein
MKERWKTPVALRKDGRAKYKYVSDTTQKTPVNARKHRRLGVLARRLGRVRMMQSDIYVSTMMREAARDARICCRVSSSSDDSRGQL